MQQTVVPGVSMWSVWQPALSVFFNSHYVESSEGNFIVDPLPLGEETAAEIDRRGGAQWIVITNRDHERDAAAVAQRFGAKIATSAPEAGLLSVPVDRTLADGDTICGASIVTLEGMKSPCEIALRLDRGRAVLVGDALWGAPAGALSFPPKLEDPARALLSLRKLAATKPRHLLVGDGTAIFERAYEALHAFFSTRGEAYVNRVNLDELRYRSDPEDPAPYASEFAEIGYLIGARKLGYAAGRLPPGAAYCPLHWHTGDEEVFLVWDGTPTLRTPRGDVKLRRGDVIAFPVGPAGAHKLINESAAPCTVFMLANDSEAETCFYPDSNKLLSSPGGPIVRTLPELDYYDGET